LTVWNLFLYRIRDGEIGAQSSLALRQAKGEGLFKKTSPNDEEDRRRGSKESKSLTHNYIAEGGAKWIEAIEKSEISEESRPYP
jgi:hypothetical protein